MYLAIVGLPGISFIVGGIMGRRCGWEGILYISSICIVIAAILAIVGLALLRDSLNKWELEIKRYVRVFIEIILSLILMGLILKLDTRTVIHCMGEGDTVRDGMHDEPSEVESGLSMEDSNEIIIIGLLLLLVIMFIVFINYITNPVNVERLMVFTLRLVVRTMIGKGEGVEKLLNDLTEGIRREGERERERRERRIWVLDTGFNEKIQDYLKEFGSPGIRGVLRSIRVIRKGGDTAIQEIMKLMFTSKLIRTLMFTFRIPGQLSGIIPDIWITFRRSYVGYRYSMIGVSIFLMMRFVSVYCRTSANNGGCLPYTRELEEVYYIVGVLLIINLSVLVIDLVIGLIYGIYKTRVYSVKQKGVKGLLGEEGMLNMLGIILKGIFALYMINQIWCTLDYHVFTTSTEAIEGLTKLSMGYGILFIGRGSEKLIQGLAKVWRGSRTNIPRSNTAPNLSGPNTGSNLPGGLPKSKTFGEEFLKELKGTVLPVAEGVNEGGKLISNIGKIVGGVGLAGTYYADHINKRQGWDYDPDGSMSKDGRGLFNDLNNKKDK